MSHSALALIVGLGNPGSEYAQTRHNAGFWYVQHLAERYHIALTSDSKYQALVGRGHIEGHDVRLLLPLTFMNRSGQSVVPFMKFYRINVSQLLIAHDELDLLPGTIKLKQGGGHGGHNGLKDIVPHIGSDFLRLRIGIGHPGHKDRVAGYVLSKAPQSEQQLIDHAISHVLQCQAPLIHGDRATAMNVVNAYKGSSI